jgi:hypothetical protein
LTSLEPNPDPEAKKSVAHKIIDSILSILQVQQKENPGHPSSQPTPLATQVSVASIALINEGGGPIHSQKRQQKRLVPKTTLKENPHTHIIITDSSER